MVAHHVGHRFHGNLLPGIDEEGQVAVQVVAHRVVQEVGSVLGNGFSVGIIVREPAAGKDVEGTPDACVTTADGAEIRRTVRFLEAERLVGSVEIAFAAGKSDDVLRIEAVVGILQGEGADAGLVGVGADRPVRHAEGHPDDALVRIDSVPDARPLADEFHDPGLVLVGDGEGLALGGVAVFIGQVHDDGDGFPGGRGPLQGDVDEGAVVDAAPAVHQFLAAAPGGLGDDDLLLVHVAHGLEGMGDLVDVAEEFPAVPVIHLEQRAGLPVRGGVIVQFAEQVVGVRRIGNQGGAVLAGALGDDDVRACIPFQRGDPVYASYLGVCSIIVNFACLQAFANL